MCLIIVKPKGATIPWKHIEAASYGNPDGFGISITDYDIGAVQSYKTTEWNEFTNAAQHIVADPNIPAVIHLRLATHGSVSTSNCHPFTTSHGYAFHHNGIFDASLTPNRHKNETDSEAFMRTYIDRTIVPNDISWIEPLMGTYNKAVIHTPDAIHILNEKAGHWYDGCWYSNYGYTTLNSKYDYFDVEDDIIEYLELNLPNANPLAKRMIISQVEEYLNWSIMRTVK